MAAPPQRLSVEALRLAVVSGHHPRIDEHLADGVGMPDPDQGTRLVNVDAEFLPQLAGQSRRARLPRFQLAARKFPGAGQMLTRKPLRDEHPAIAAEHRAGDDVVCSLPISFAQAALGSEIEIPTLEGKGKLRVPPGTQPNTVLRVKGKGVPRRMTGGRGDQLVEVTVEVPTQLTSSQRELVAKLAEDLGESVQPQQASFMEKLKALFG